MNLITDDDFRDFVDQVPDGCRITIVSDSCHSGGLIDQAKEQIGESHKNKGYGHDDEEEKSSKKKSSSSGGFGFKKFLGQTAKEAIESRGFKLPSEFNKHLGLEDEHVQNRDIDFDFESDEGPGGYVKSRNLPVSTLIDMLKQQTGKQDIDVGKLRPTLFDVFGEDASPKVKKFMKVILGKLQSGGGGGGGGGGIMGMVGNLAQEFLKHQLDDHDEGYAKPAMDTQVDDDHEVYAGSHNKRSFPDGGILISGCQTHQTSADASPSGNPAKAYGALSNAIQTIIAETGGEVGNYELVTRARELLKKQKFTQQPGLYCCDDHVDAPFI